MRYTQLFPTNDYSNIDKLIENSQKNHEHLKEIDKKQKAKGTILFRHFTVPVADGYSYYQITKVGKKTATVELCGGICLDEYQDMILGESATISLDIAKSQIERMDALYKLFGNG